MTEQNQRVGMMDALRGFSLCVMVCHHFCYDLCAFCGAPWVLFENPLLAAVHYIFGGIFVLLSGVSSNFSRSNVRRGIRALAVALGITAVTWLVGLPILYGVLHLLGTCMLLYGLTQRFWERLNGRIPWLTPVLAVAGTVLTAPLAGGRLTTTPHLWIFGFITADFWSSDYFPLLPWGFVFLFGAWAGKYVRAGRMPRWCYEARLPRLAALGRHSMLVYIVHQPLLYALSMLIRFVSTR